jgi:acyl carrier protein
MENRLIKILAAIFDMPANQIHASLTKHDIYKWDSLVQMELVSSIENEFNIQLTIDEMVSMDSVQKIADILKKYGVTE